MIKHVKSGLQRFMQKISHLNDALWTDRAVKVGQGDQIKLLPENN